MKVLRIDFFPFILFTLLLFVGEWETERRRRRRRRRKGLGRTRLVKKGPDIKGRWENFPCSELYLNGPGQQLSLGAEGWSQLRHKEAVKGGASKVQTGGETHPSVRTRRRSLISCSIQHPHLLCPNYAQDLATNLFLFTLLLLLLLLFPTFLLLLLPLGRRTTQ